LFGLTNVGYDTLRVNCKERGLLGQDSKDTPSAARGLQPSSSLTFTESPVEVLVRDTLGSRGRLVPVATGSHTRNLRTLEVSVIRDVAGKSGTARRAEAGRYDGRSYNSTFAGMFPAQAPQYVLVVRLVDPQGKIFGGTVAGRVVNNILQSALAMRNAGLDRVELAGVAKPLPTAPVRPMSASAIAAARRDTARFDSLRAPTLPAPTPIAVPSRVIVALPFARPASGVADAERLPSRPVPSVLGLDVRQATRTLHAAGFHVTVVAGEPGRTRPAAGTLAPPGTLIALEIAK
jgi:hypothetical protein